MCILKGVYKQEGVYKGDSDGTKGNGFKPGEV